MLYAEDLEVGRTFTLGTWTVSAEEIIAFATTWDPLPFHVDPAAAAASSFGEVIASGAHTFAIAIRLVADGMTAQLAVVAGRGLRELRWPKPVRPGARLTGTAVVVEQRLRPHGRAVITSRTEIVDQDGDVVLSMDLDSVVEQLSGPAAG